MSVGARVNVADEAVEGGGGEGRACLLQELSELRVGGYGGGSERGVLGGLGGRVTGRGGKRVRGVR